MHILKLPWLGHKAEGKPVECYSVSVNADGSRLASGGLDGNVKIWDTHTILQFKSVEIDGDFDRLLPPKPQRRPLCSMSRHNGVVTSVKFSPDGRFLASGSDDKIVLIWEKDELMINRPKQFGEAEADMEHWTVRKRLVAHDNDIQDICWSPDGSLLVTVGLDRSIMIWSGKTFERIKRYDVHQSMVKGIVFDPANKFFATASDDRTVRIFRYSKKLHESANNYEFQIEHVVFDPFKKSPLTSYFRRMSWSPDGQNIAVPNATNGPVPSVAIIKRGNWSSEVSLIGHEAPCEVCSFSPRLFESDGDKDNFDTILATGGQDRTLAIWSTKQAKPLLVAHEITGGSITDICWDNTGQSLFFSCVDGSITCLAFEKEELGIPIDQELMYTQLHKFGKDRESNVFPESIEQLELEEKAEKLDVQPISDKKPKEITPRPSPRIESSPSMPTMSPLKSDTQKLDIRSQKITMKNGKKRVAPLLLSALTNTPVLTVSKVTKKFKVSSKLSHNNYLLPRLGVATAVRGLKFRAQENVNPNNEDQDNDNDDMNFDMGNEGGNLSVVTLKNQKRKIKRVVMESKYPNHFKLISNLSESLFNHSLFMKHEMSKIINSHDFQNTSDLFSGSSATADTHDEDIVFAVLVSSITHKMNPLYELDATEVQPVKSIIEVRNGAPWKEDEEDIDLEYDDTFDFQDPTSVIVSNDKNGEFHKYLLYFPFKIQHCLPVVINGMLIYYVIVSFTGTLTIFLAESGSLVTPNVEIGSNLICLKQYDKFLMGVTSSGLIHIWELPEFPRTRNLKILTPPISLSAIMNANLKIELDSMIISPNVKAIELDKNGTPYVLLDDTNDVFKYSVDLMIWVKVIDSWYYNSIDDITPCKEILGYFQHLSYQAFKNDVQRLKTGKYIFNEETKELKDIMNQRHNELMHCK